MNVPQLKHGEGSYIVRNKRSKEVVTELFSKSIAEKINFAKYEVIGIGTYLSEFNRTLSDNSKMLLPSLESIKAKLVNASINDLHLSWHHNKSTKMYYLNHKDKINVEKVWKEPGGKGYGCLSGESFRLLADAKAEALAKVKSRLYTRFEELHCSSWEYDLDNTSIYKALEVDVIRLAS